MSTLLHIEASPRGERSKSTAVAKSFLDSYQKAHLDDEVVTLNLFDAELPVLDAGTLAAKYKYLHGQEPTPEESKRWAPVVAAVEVFKSADKIVISTPMWNFSIPYRLKHYIDILVQPGLTFSYTPEEGYTGLVTGKRVLIVCARGGQYAEGSDAAAFDMQTKYLELILGFIGLAELTWVIAEPLLMGGPDVAAKAVEAAKAQAAELAKTF